MNDDRLERLVSAATRGIMQAVLDFADPPAVKESLTTPPAPVFTAPPEDMLFPSVTRAQDELFGETMPSNNADLDSAIAAVAKARKQAEQDAQPDVQPGPGETEVTEWLRVPQA